MHSAIAAALSPMTGSAESVAQLPNPISTSTCRTHTPALHVAASAWYSLCWADCPGCAFRRDRHSIGDPLIMTQ